MSTVSLFIPCLVDVFLPEVGEATHALLRRLGQTVIYHPEQTCCGQPAINSGYRAQAQQTAKHFIDVFGDDEVVVCPSGSCVHTVKERYPELLQDEPRWRRRAEDLASRVYELSQYLVDVLHVEDVGARFDGTVTYHESCQLLRGLGVSEQPKRLLRAVKGAELILLPKAETCCGFGGSFSNSYPDISEAMVADKAACYLESGADILVTCDPGCLLNIGGYLSRHHPEKESMHIASFLARDSEKNQE